MHAQICCTNEILHMLKTFDLDFVSGSHKLMETTF